MDFDHQQTIGKINLTWLHFEQVGGGEGRYKNRMGKEEDKLSVFLQTSEIVLPSQLTQ